MRSHTFEEGTQHGIDVDCFDERQPKEPDTRKERCFWRDLRYKFKSPVIAALLATVVFTLPLLVANALVKPGFWGTEEQFCKDFWDLGGWGGRLEPAKREEHPNLGAHRAEWNSSFCMGNTSAEALTLAAYQFNEWCEGIRVEAFVRTPANSWTGMAFVFSGGWSLGHARQKTREEGRILFVLQGIAAMLMGLGSFFMHASFKRWANDMDVGWMVGWANASISTSLWRMLVRWRKVGPKTFCDFAPLFVIPQAMITAICYILMAQYLPLYFDINVPSISLTLTFSLQLAIIIVCEATLVFTQLCYSCTRPVFCKDLWVGVAALLSGATGKVFWDIGIITKSTQHEFETSTICHPDRWVQPHAIWHSLCGIALWALIELQATSLPTAATWDIAETCKNLKDLRRESLNSLQSLRRPLQVTEDETAPSRDPDDSPQPQKLGNGNILAI